MSKPTLAQRRNTIAQDAHESLIEEAKKENVGIDPKKKLTIREKVRKIGTTVYNSEYREFLSRDALAWFKLALCYSIFYFFLASFFVVMLVIFYQIIDLKTPTYYNKKSVMNYRGVNPGLGFRPQLNPESELIRVDSANQKENFKAIELFLEKYDKYKNETFLNHKSRSVSYDYEAHTANTPCTKERKFGYADSNPCVIVKLNRIFGWMPVLEKDPSKLTELDLDENALNENCIYVKCRGDGGVDRDNINQIEYYSLGKSNKYGCIPKRYFPYRNQPHYLSPLVFVHFKNISLNTLVNVECKAYAKNIDNTDKVNLRGMVKFQLFVS